MDDNASDKKRDDSEIESLKKTTRIFLDDALLAKAAPKKTTTSIAGQADDKQSTGPIMGIPTHKVSPIPQTIRLKRPSTSPIVISPPDITTAPTVVKTARSKPPTAPVGENATVIRPPSPQRPLKETSRIILELGPQAAESPKKTSPIPAISPLEPTPGPKTIRLKRPSTIIAEAAGEMQAAKKSETAKIDLPKEAEYLTPATQRKTIKIKRTDRNIIARTVSVTRQAEARPPAKAAAPEKKPAPEISAPEEPLPVFSILAGLTAVCLVLLAYLLTAQAFGPELILPVPSGLF
ncbi:MAG: hypothetical protein PHP98_00810 [Kiritimatiellae bacterium]|nr:hypothetical protein [Kiritimatiellia bacterium]